jgi:hypothetical protein
MRNGMRTLTAILGLLLLAGTAAATSANGACKVAGAGASALCEAGAYPDDQYHDADASAASEHASGMVDADASHTDAEKAADGSLFGWLSLHWGAFIAKLNDAFGAAGQETPSVDGGVDLYASTDGVDLDATVGGVTFDGSAAGDLDGKTFETMDKVDAAKGDAESKVQQTKSDVEGKLPVTLG